MSDHNQEKLSIKLYKNKNETSLIRFNVNQLTDALYSKNSCYQQPSTYN